MLRFIVTSWLSLKIIKLMWWITKTLIWYIRLIFAYEFWVLSAFNIRAMFLVFKNQNYPPSCWKTCIMKIRLWTKQHIYLTLFCLPYFLVYYWIWPEVIPWTLSTWVKSMAWYSLFLKLYFLGIIIWLIIVVFFLDIEWYDEQKRLIEEYEKKHGIRR